MKHSKRKHEIESLTYLNSPGPILEMIQIAVKKAFEEGYNTRKRHVTLEAKGSRRSSTSPFAVDVEALLYLKDEGWME